MFSSSSTIFVVHFSHFFHSRFSLYWHPKKKIPLHKSIVNYCDFFLSGYRARGIWEWPSEDQIEPKERNYCREFRMKWNFSSIKHNFPDFFSLSFTINLYSLHFFLVPFTSTGGIKSCGKKFDFNWDFFTYSEETFCTFVTTQHTELSFFLVDRMDGRSFYNFSELRIECCIHQIFYTGKKLPKWNFLLVFELLLIEKLAISVLFLFYPEQIQTPILWVSRRNELLAARKVGIIESELLWNTQNYFSIFLNFFFFFYATKHKNNFLFLLFSVIWCGDGMILSSGLDSIIAKEQKMNGKFFCLTRNKFFTLDSRLNSTCNLNEQSQSIN